MKFCPKCATKNADEAAVCRNAACGHRFASPGGGAAPCNDKPPAKPGLSASGSAAKAPGDGSPAKRYCHKCGSLNDGEATKCRCCGAALPATPRPAANPIQHPGPKRPLPDETIPKAKQQPPGLWRLVANLPTAAKVAAVIAVCLGIGILSQMGSQKQQTMATASSTYARAGNHQRSTAACRGNYEKAFAILSEAIKCDATRPIGEMMFGDFSPHFNKAKRRVRSMGYSDEEIDNMGRQAASQLYQQWQLQNNLVWDMQIASYDRQIASIKAASAKLDSENKIKDLENSWHDHKMANIEVGHGTPEYVSRFGTAPTGSTITWDSNAATRWNIPYVPWSINVAPFFP